MHRVLGNQIKLLFFHADVTQPARQPQAGDQFRDRIGRAKTMLITILLYSLFTGLSSLAVSPWDFSFYRFLTGLGVGGEFAVGVS